MKPKRLQHIEEINNKIQNSKSKVADLYENIENEKGYQNKLELELHRQAIYEYQDRELRCDIVNKAIQYNYPEEDLKDVILYTVEGKKWDNSIDSGIIDKYIEIDLYNEEYSKRIPKIKKIGNMIYEIFKTGGNDS